MGDIQQYCDALLLEIGSTNYEFIISCLKHFIYPIPRDIHIQRDTKNLTKVPPKKKFTNEYDMLIGQ